jgi:hypothetical protein
MNRTLIRHSRAGGNPLKIKNSPLCGDKKAFLNKSAGFRPAPE